MYRSGKEEKDCRGGQEEDHTGDEEDNQKYFIWFSNLQVIKELDEKKKQALRTAWDQV